MSKLKQGEIKSSKRKTTCYIQVNPHKTISRNSAGQKGGAWYSQSTGGEGEVDGQKISNKKYPTHQSYSEVREFYRQAKPKAVYHY